MHADASPEDARFARDVDRAVRRVDWLPSPVAGHRRTAADLRAALTTAGARRWYVGATGSIVFAVAFLAMPLFRDAAPLEATIWAVLLALFCVAFVLSAPIATVLPPRWRWAVPGVLFVFSLGFIPEMGAGMTGLWIYVVVSFAICVMDRRLTLVTVFAISALSLWFASVDPISGTPPWTLPLITMTAGIMMMTFADNIKTVRLLQATRDELAQVAVEEERNRVGRDMHDVLGHSLSAISVKADLAATLAERDPDRAAREIREVQTLARSTLGDMRAVVSGYRQVRVASELASLRRLLPSAGIVAHVPSATEDVAEEHRELFGWVLREAVTNVIRHAGATNCWVTITPHSIRVEDDGVGPAAGDVSGSGLIGLTERTNALGGRLTIGRSRRGGFLIEATVV